MCFYTFSSADAILGTIEPIRIVEVLQTAAQPPGMRPPQFHMH